MLIVIDEPAAAPSKPMDRAAWLFPESEYLQAEWRRAIQTVRATRRGWLLDKPIQKQENRNA